MLRRLVALWKNEDGPTTVEYALLLVLIVIIAIVAWQTLGNGVNAAVTEVNTKMPAPM